MADDVKFRMGDREVEAREAEDAPILVADEDFERTRQVLAFESEEEFQRFASGHRHAAVLERIQRVVDEAQKLEDDEDELAIEMHRESAERIEGDLERLARRTGLKWPSHDAFVRATSERRLIEPPIFNSMLLWDNLDGTGRVRPVIVTIPNLGWLNFDDQTSSLSMFGAGFIAERTWYRGRKFYVLGLSGAIPLDVVLFDNIASSAVILPI